MSATTQDVYDLLLAVDQKLNLLLRRQSREEKELMSFSDDLKARLDTLTGDVTVLTSAVDGAKALIAEEVQTIADLKAQLANAGVDPALLAIFDTATATIEAKSAELASAVAANTAPPTA